MSIFTFSIAARYLPSESDIRLAPALRYSSKASRTGLRVCDLFEWEHFETLYRSGLVSKQKRFGGFPCVGPL